MGEKNVGSIGEGLKHGFLSHDEIIDRRNLGKISYRIVQHVTLHRDDCINLFARS